MTEVENFMNEYIHNNGSNFYPTIWLYDPYSKFFIRYVESSMYDIFFNCNDLSCFNELKSLNVPFIMNVCNSSKVYFFDYDQDNDFIYTEKDIVPIYRSAKQSKYITPSDEYIDRVKKYLLFKNI